MKLCKDCKWYWYKEAEKGYSEQERCSNPKIREELDIDLVDGSYEPEWTVFPWCFSQRMAGWFEARMTGSCGKDGRFFEAKQ